MTGRARTERTDRTSTPIWSNRAADVIIVSGTLDALALGHVRHRLEHALAALDGMRLVGTEGSYVDGPSHLLFENGLKTWARLIPHDDSLVITVRTELSTTQLKMPADKSGEDASDPRVPAAIVSAALASMGGHVVMSEHSLATGTVSEELIAGMTDPQRTETLRVLTTACALIAAGNPDRDPSSVVRILLAHPGREARIVDRRSASLFRKPVERALTAGLPSVLSVSSSTHGYVDLQPAQVAMQQGEAHLDPMRIMRIISESGIDPNGAVLSAAMGA